MAPICIGAYKCNTVVTTQHSQGAYTLWDPSFMALILLKKVR